MKLKTIIFLLCLLIVVFAFASCGEKQKIKEEHKSEPFIYEENSDGTVTITGWTGLENELIIPSEINGKTVTKIGENAFHSVKDLVYVKIPDTVKDIDYAFLQCTGLKTVELGSGIQKMNGAFGGCTSLTTITGGEYVVEMSEAFEGCTSLTSGVISATVRSCASAFKNCTSLVGVNIEAGTTALNYTFEGCTALVSVTIPETVVEAICTFEGCTMLKAISGEENIEVYEATFKGCTALKEITLGANVRVMKEAFVDCSVLEKINGLPDAVEEYHTSFTGCSSLTEIIIPESTVVVNSKYDLISDIKGCMSVETLKVLTPFNSKLDFCKTFSGLSFLEELIIPDENFVSMMKVDSFYVDAIYTGNADAVASVLDYALNTTYVRVTDNYGNIDGVSYVHVQGTDINIFDPDEIERETEILGFRDFKKHTYWCGYPEGSNRQTSAVAIERTYTFYLRVTGKNDGSLPPEISVNGVRCLTETMSN